MEKQWIDACLRWIEKKITCEAYFVHHEEKINGFVEYRNGGHLLYIIGNEKTLSQDQFIDILAHEAGHVIYNQVQMAKGISYESIVERTQKKLHAFDQLLLEGTITDEEYERLYDSMEEEYYSNQQKEKMEHEIKLFLLNGL